MSDVPEVHPRFGPLVRVGRASRVVGGLLAGAGGLILLPVGLALLAFVPTSESVLGAVGVIVGTSPFWLLGAVLLRSGLKYGAQTLAVYQGGFVRLDFRDRVEAAWTEIEGIRRSTYTRDGAILCDKGVIEMRGKKPLVALDIALSDFGQVGVALDEKSAAALTPRFEEALARGQIVSFGAVTMTASGLGLEGKTSGWDELHSIYFFQPSRGLGNSITDKYSTGPTVTFDIRPKDGDARKVVLGEEKLLNPSVFTDLAERVGKANVLGLRTEPVPS
jgi:hypothetical protein